MSDWPHLLDFARQNAGQTMALASLVAREGSSYRQPGARMLVTADGNHAGTLSGGCLEDGIATVAQRVLDSGRPETLHIDTRPHFGCPGKLRVFVEPVAAESLTSAFDLVVRRQEFHLATYFEGAGTRIFREDEEDPNQSGVLIEKVGPRSRLVVIGWTSDSDPLLRMASMLGWDLHRVSRMEMAAVAGETVVVCAEDEFAAKFPADAMTAVLIMTHRLTTDLGFLKAVLPEGYGYIGLLGSRRRRETLLAEAGACGLLEDPSVAERFYAPVGLDLGGEHPATIALAILAEIQAVFTGSSAGFLRDRLGIIHHPRGAGVR
jgi:xanthine/CO dehydrogenase XdhC/CoxF family maturation factor